MGNKLSKRARKSTHTLSKSKPLSDPPASPPFCTSLGTGVTCLPAELWELIFTYLPPPDAWRARLVCRAFRDHVEYRVSLPWLVDSWIDRVISLSRGQDFALRIQDGRNNWVEEHSAGYWRLVSRNDRHLQFALPANAAVLHESLLDIQKRISHARSNMQRVIIRREIRFFVPLWIRMLESASLNVVVSTQQFHLSPSAVLHSVRDSKVRSGKTHEGFRVVFREEGSMLLIDRRVLFSTMFGAPQFRYIER